VAYFGMQCVIVKLPVIIATSEMKRITICLHVVVFDFDFYQEVSN